LKCVAFEYKFCNRYSESVEDAFYVFEGGEELTHKEYRDKQLESVRKAHKELFDKYCNYVYTIVFNKLRNCVSLEDIDECVCDVFADVYIYYDSNRSTDGDLSGFIGTIARRKAASYYHRCHKADITVSIDDDAEIDSGINVENEIDKKERRRIILEKIDELGEPDSTIIIQKYYYGLSSKEIGEIVSLTPENVRVRSGRAIKKLRELLEKAGITL
jgi:RNA polymerase sigma-70 factor (ECF subfamily)